MIDITAHIQQDVPLAPLTTIRLGGTADFLVECTSVEEIQAALAFADERQLAVHVLGGGSNSIFADAGWRGLVIRVKLAGLEFVEDGDYTVVNAAAGEVWDDLVQQCVDRDLAGIETLSGIPGLVGATPMQNVGAYGQEVADSIVLVRAIDRTQGGIVEFTNEDCHFTYRGSRFKYDDKDRYIIVAVAYRLQLGGQAMTQYPQVQQLVGDKADLRGVREAVLQLRRSKSMVLDEADPNTQSCGSFFVNPVVGADVLKHLQARWPDMPYFEGEESATASARADWVGKHVKIPAAWLIEQAGFMKGERRGNVGISANHVLALVNHGGTAKELLDFADEIVLRVKQEFGIVLVREPEFVVNT